MSAAVVSQLLFLRVEGPAGDQWQITGTTQLPLTGQIGFKI